MRSPVATSVVAPGEHYLCGAERTSGSVVALVPVSRPYHRIAPLFDVVA